MSSHLKWRNFNIWQIEAKGEYVTCDNIYLRANATMDGLQAVKIPTKIMSNLTALSSGYRNEAFYGGGSDFQFARSHSKVKGHVYDVELAVGYQFKMCDDSFQCPVSWLFVAWATFMIII